nr:MULTISPECIES: hypothetical protein [unclassified Pseudomonas]
MSTGFDMDLFLAGVLTGSYTTRQRHLHQAKAIQTAIAERWHRDNPWTWQRKHVIWFLRTKIQHRAAYTRYFYKLTAELITLRLNKKWRYD